MPTAHTVETIMNGALDIVGERPMASLTDTRPETRWLIRNYVSYVQAALRQNIWNFACELHELNEDPTQPAFRWRHAYWLPNGWLRVVPPTYNGERHGRPIPHEVKGNRILTNATAPLPVELVMDMQMPGEWDPIFASMIIARLAAGIAQSITHKKSYTDTANQMAQNAYDTAEEINAFEGSPAPTEQHDVIRVRGL
jgi:hypothetical protein